MYYHDVESEEQHGMEQGQGERRRRRSVADRVAAVVAVWRRRRRRREVNSHAVPVEKDRSSTNE